MALQNADLTSVAALEALKIAPCPNRPRPRKSARRAAGLLTLVSVAIAYSDAHYLTYTKVSLPETEGGT